MIAFYWLVMLLKGGRFSICGTIDQLSREET
jgi:hypothetical protein